MIKSDIALIINKDFMDKLVVINISEDQLDTFHWDKINKIFKSVVFKNQDDIDLLDELKDTNAIFSKFNPVSKEMIDSAPNLKYIGVFATGYGKVDLKEAKNRNITVSNIPGYSTESVAEFTIGALLEYLRELTKAKVEASKGNYDESIYKASELKDKQFGVVGLGRIGRRVAELAYAFGSKVSYFSRSDKNVPTAAYSSFEDVFINSEIISINCSLTQETEGIINSQILESIKKGTVIINTSPMELFNFDDLIDALGGGNFTLIWDHSDEMSEENLKKIQSFDNCITYPPIGYITREASKAKKDIFIENLEHYLKGDKLNVVN